ncbi:hypothetical protein N0V90_009521 [Kalmusia sp. IMI 367209]|nr:hypothetical protein N0V90_009521 [Kalmusia sp. IMI 367209]
MAPSSTPTVYFGYGSNLWLHQMRTRCPTSTYLGVARLTNYAWIINDRGYANVVSSPSSTSISDRYTHAVFGLVFSLLPADEKRLDANEGVPRAYTKEYLTCDFWASSDGKPIDANNPPTKTKQMLVYIDRKRVTEDKPKEEYVYRMNRGIEDALKMGVPRAYVKEVMRRFIPEDGEGEKRRSLEDKARRQAVEFVDENEK